MDAKLWPERRTAPQPPQLSLPAATTLPSLGPVSPPSMSPAPGHSLLWGALRPPSRALLCTPGPQQEGPSSGGPSPVPRLWARCTVTVPASPPDSSPAGDDSPLSACPLCPAPWPQLRLTWSCAWRVGVNPQTPENRQTRLCPGWTSAGIDFPRSAWRQAEKAGFTGCRERPLEPPFSWRCYPGPPRVHIRLEEG